MRGFMKNTFMSKNKIVALSLSVLALFSSTMLASAAPVASSGTRFSASLKLGASFSRNKVEIAVSKHAINSILNQTFLCTNDADYFFPLMAMSDTDIDQCQGAEGSDVRDSASSQHLVADNLASNVQKIISNRYKSGGKDAYTKVKAYQDDLTKGLNSIKGINIGLAADLVLGIKMDRFGLGLVGSFDMPLKGRTSTAAWSKSEQTTDTNKKDSSSKSDDKNKSSTDTSLDMTVKSKYGFGVGVSLWYDINKCFSLGTEAGWKRSFSEIDATNMNVNLLGVTGTPKYDAAKKIPEKNCDNKDALKGARSDKGIDKLTGVLDVLYVGVTMSYRLTKYLGFFLSGGVQSAGTLKMKDGKTKITNPDFVAERKMSIYGKAGLELSI